MAGQACLRCRNQKRKCDRLLPLCTLCKRLNKRCCYSLPAEAPRLLPIPDAVDLTPFNLQHTLEVQVSSIVGDGVQLQEAIALYFRTIHTWFPIVSQAAYQARLSSLRGQAATAPSEFSLLTLCMALACKEPVNGELSPLTRSLYASIKSFVALLEAIGTNSLQMLQSRALLTIFEIGYAIYPAAYISAAGNVCAAVALGINATSKELRELFLDSQKAEEARQTWHGIVIAERYTSLESNQTPNTCRERPVDGFSVNGVKLDSFTGMAHASQLLGQALVLVHTPVFNPLLEGAEAVETLKSLTSFLEILQTSHLKAVPITNGAVALSRSAMLEILEVGSHMNIPDNEFCISTSVSILKSLVYEISHEAMCFPIETSNGSVFLSHCIYKTAMMCLADRRVPGDDLNSIIRPLKALLGYLGTRWVAATQYLARIETAHTNHSS